MPWGLRVLGLNIYEYMNIHMCVCMYTYIHIEGLEGEQEGPQLGLYSGYFEDFPMVRELRVY